MALARFSLRRWQRRVVNTLADPGFRRSPLVHLGRRLAWEIQWRRGRPVTVPLREWAARLSVPPRRGGVERKLWLLREHYEPEITAWISALRSGATAIDVGACYGVYTIAAARAVGPAGRVIAVEPLESTFTMLEDNLRRNGADRVTTVRCALGAQPGSARIAPSREDTGQAALSTTGAGDAVDVRTLDELVNTFGLRDVGAIKIDVEGAEELVLRGGLDTLRRWQPTIVYEVNPRAAARLGLEPDGAARLLATIGYRVRTPNKRDGMTYWNAIAEPL